MSNRLHTIDIVVFQCYLFASSFWELIVAINLVGSLRASVDSLPLLREYLRLALSTIVSKNDHNHIVIDHIQWDEESLTRLKNVNNELGRGRWFPVLMISGKESGFSHHDIPRSREDEVKSIFQLPKNSVISQVVASVEACIEGEEGRRLARLFTQTFGEISHTRDDYERLGFGIARCCAYHAAIQVAFTPIDYPV